MTKEEILQILDSTSDDSLDELQILKDKSKLDSNIKEILLEIHEDIKKVPSSIESINESLVNIFQQEQEDLEITDEQRFNRIKSFLLMFTKQPKKYELNDRVRNTVNEFLLKSKIEGESLLEIELLLEKLD